MRGHIQTRLEAAAVGQSAEMRAIVKRLNEASHAEVADMMIADTARFFRRQAAMGMGYFVAHNRGARADSALDALIRAYEGIEEQNAAYPPHMRWNGVSSLLRYIFGAQNPRGEAYVRELFETAEPPPVCKRWRPVTEEPEEGCGPVRRDPLDTPYCMAGRVLHGEEVDEARGFGRGPNAGVAIVSHRPERPPEVRGLSEPAARWWSRCWDNRWPYPG